MNLLSKLGISAAALFLAASVAEASPLTGTFNITIYQATCGTGAGCLSSNPDEQAQLGNPLITPADEIAAGTYVGTLNWQQAGSGNGTLAPFLNTTGTFTPSFGTLSGHALSSAPFALTTVFVITGNLGGSVLSGNIQHDDGMDLYDGGSGFATLVANSAAPTSEVPTPYSGVTGNFGVVYVEANGLPADFVFNVTSRVPEPLTLSLFGAMLAGAAAGFRRRQNKATQA